MLAKLFSNISVQSLISALFFSLLLIVAAWMLTDMLYLPFDVLGYSTNLNGVLLKILISTVLLFFSWWFNNRINALGFLKEDYHLIPVLILILGPHFFVTPSAEWVLLFPMGIFLHWRLLQLSEVSDPSMILFDSGLLLALMTILEPATSFLMLTIWMATLNFGHLNIRTFLMPLMGFAACCFMLFTVLYGFFSLNVLPDFFYGFTDIFDWDLSAALSRSLIYLPLLLIGFPALFETVQVYGKASVKKRQIFGFLTTHFILTALAGFFFADGVLIWIWLAFPLAVFIANLLHYTRRAWMKDVIYLMLMLFFVLSLL